MPEACFLCLDSTEFMRNGDQFPNRMLAEQEAANLLVNAKIQSNAENTVGFLTMGGAACTVFETLTPDVDRVMATLTKISIGGKRCHFANGLLIASLALSHRTNPRAEKRIVAFVGSPLQETGRELELLARRLRKDDVAVDVVAFGAEGNTPLLETFVEKVNKGGNSRLLSVLDSANLTDALMGSPILLGEENFAAMGGGGGGGGASAGGGMGFFSVDPNVDPELAMAIRLSMEDEERRQAALAAAAAPATSADGGGAAPAPAPSSAAQPAQATPGEDDVANMDEEEELRRAVAMSLAEAGGAGSSQPPQPQPQPPLAGSAGGNEEDEDAEFQRQLQAIADMESKSKESGGGAGKK